MWMICLCPDIAQLYKKDLEEYKRIAKEWTLKYAT